MANALRPMTGTGHKARPPSGTSGPSDPVIRCVTSTGIRRLHDRYITSPRQVHDRLDRIQSLREHRKPLRHDAAARPASRPAQRRSPRYRASLPLGGGRRALGHRLRGSLNGMAPIWQPAPAAGTNKTSPPPSASRTPENRTARMRGMHQPDDQSGRPYKGTKRARIGKGSGYTHC